MNYNKHVKPIIFEIRRRLPSAFDRHSPASWDEIGELFRRISTRAQPKNGGPGSLPHHISLRRQTLTFFTKNLSDNLHI
jgi:hypothetical protein